MKTNFILLIVLASMFIPRQKKINGDHVPGTGVVTSPITDGNATCKACAYYPTCTSSYYVYSVVNYIGDSISIVAYNDTLSYIKDTSINNVSFTKIYSSGGTGNLYYSCADGSTRNITYSNPTTGGNTTDVKDVTLLKADLPVGGTWQDTVKDPSTGLPSTISSTIMEKGITSSVNGVTFSDVIHVQAKFSISAQQFTRDTYFAKGVGLIESTIVYNTSFNYNTGQASLPVNVFHETIKNYSIPQ